MLKGHCSRVCPIVSMKTVSIAGNTLENCEMSERHRPVIPWSRLVRNDTPQQACARLKHAITRYTLRPMIPRIPTLSLPKEKQSAQYCTLLPTLSNILQPTNAQHPKQQNPPTCSPSSGCPPLLRCGGVEGQCRPHHRQLTISCPKSEAVEDQQSPKRRYRKD
jgi:hypothetical protein